MYVLEEWPVSLFFTKGLTETGEITKIYKRLKVLRVKIADPNEYYFSCSLALYCSCMKQQNERKKGQCDGRLALLVIFLIQFIRHANGHKSASNFLVS